MTKSYVSPLALILLALTLITAAAGFVLVPAGTTLPIHWGPSGEADGFAPRELALAMPVVITLVIWVIFLAIQRFGPKQQVDRSRAMSRAALTMLTALFLCIAMVTVLIGTGVAIDMVRVLAAGVGLLLLALGNAMPKSRPNSLAGLRIPTTLADPANWHETHRLAGPLAMISGGVLVLAALLLPVSALFWAILACVILPAAAGVIYSLRLARHQAP